MRYRIIRNLDEVVCYVERGNVNVPIGHYLHIKNHSPSGFEYGYSGSGPSQLALAILCHYTSNDRQALAHYHQFKDRFIAPLDQSVHCHIIDGDDIEAFLHTLAA